MWDDQASYDIRCDWGLSGLRKLSPVSDVVIIVDVLSFSTCVDVAVGRGAIVYPYRFRDATATAFAAEQGARLAEKRGKGVLSLSPGSMSGLAAGEKVVLPSPNGAALSLEAGKASVLAGCLRNWRAVAAAAMRLGGRIAIIAAGEQWPDGSLRPGIEDWLGAGAIASALPGKKSPEAELAARTFVAAGAEIGGLIRDSVSGRELCDRGFEEDVRAATETGASQTVPVLVDGAYRAAAISNLRAGES